MPVAPPPAPKSTAPPAADAVVVCTTLSEDTFRAFSLAELNKTTASEEACVAFSLADKYKADALLLASEDTCTAFSLAKATTFILAAKAFEYTQRNFLLTCTALFFVAMTKAH